jgi:O-antigen ligase
VKKVRQFAYSTAMLNFKFNKNDLSPCENKKFRLHSVTKNLYNKIISKVVFNSSAFRIAYIMDIFLGSIIGLTGIAVGFGVIILCWSFLLIIHNFLLTGLCFKTRFYPIIFAFLLSILLTKIIRFTDNFLSNFFTIYHLFSLIFIFYGMYTEKNVKEIRKEVILFCKITVYTSTFLSILGLIIAIFLTHIKVEDYWGCFYIGICANRLTGVYLNSNVLGSISAVAVICCHIVFKDEKRFRSFRKTLPLRIIIICFVFNSLSLLLSDSNNSFLFLILYITILVFCRLFIGGQKIRKDILKKVSLLLIFCFTFPFLSFILRNSCQYVFNYVVSALHFHIIPVQDNKDLDLKEEIIGRKISDDPTSGRIMLIKQGIELFCKFPLIGVGGENNIIDYSKKYLKDGLIYPDLHNGYLTILVSYGTIGFVMFFCFTIKVLAKICKFLFMKYNKLQCRCFENLFAVIIAFGVYSLFETSIPAKMTFIAGFFWLILGYTTAHVYQKKKIKLEIIEF